MPNVLEKNKVLREEPRMRASGAGGSPGVEESTRKAMQMLSALSDAAVSGGKLSAEMSSTTNAGNAKCQPWSRQDFLSRLASFSPMNWFNKPVASTAPSLPT